MPHPTLSRLAGRTLPVALAALLMSGCASLDGPLQKVVGFVTPYRADVLQGNVVTKEQLAVLKPGLTREQVRQLLGAPLLADMFHESRWDYIFTIRRQGVEVQRRSLVVLFEGERVSKVDAPELPSEYEFVASISPAPVAESTRKLALSDEERAALPPPAPREAAASAAAPLGAARTYPPLETR